MKVVIFLFKRLVCLPVAIFMFITIASLIPAIFIVPVYWVLTNRDYVEDAGLLFDYSNDI